MRYTTEYNPEISETCKTYISNNVGLAFQVKILIFIRLIIFPKY